jgi:tetratricopeptide (TPR) repeat protein
VARRPRRRQKRVDAEHALNDAREIDQAATSMFALFHASVPSVCCGNYAAASAFLDELVRLADEKGALFWKALGMLMRGYSLALTDKTSDAVQITTSGLAALRSTGSTVWLPLWLSYLAAALAERGQLDEAWRCIDEALTLIEKTKERLHEAEVTRIAGEIALKAPQSSSTKAEAYFERALAWPPAASKILGTARRHEHGAALARSGQAG